VAHLFISHIHEEAEAAGAVLRFLKESKLEAFLSSDHWQIRAGAVVRPNRCRVE